MPDHLGLDDLREEIAVWREEAIRQRQRCRLLEGEHSRVLSKFGQLRERIALLESKLKQAGVAA